MSSPMVQKTIKKPWVAHNIGSDAGHRLKAYSDFSRLTSQSFDTDLVVIDDTDDITQSNPVLVVDGFTFQSIGNTMTHSRWP